MSRGPGKLMVAIRDAVLAKGGKGVTSTELATAFFGPDFTDDQASSVRRALRNLPPAWGIAVHRGGMLEGRTLKAHAADVMQSGAVSLQSNLA